MNVDNVVIIKTVKISPIVWIGNSGIVGDGFKLGLAVCGIVELGVGVVEAVAVGLVVGEGVGVEVGDVKPSARVA